MVVSDLAVVDDDDLFAVTSSRARSLSESDVSDLCASPVDNNHETARSSAYSPGEVLLPVGSSHYHHHHHSQQSSSSHMGRSSCSNSTAEVVKPPPKPILPPKLKQRPTIMDRYDSSSSADSPSNLQETFVDAERAAAAAKGFLNRSASSVTSKTRAPIAKPVRRSKSQHFHGGKAVYKADLFFFRLKKTPLVLIYFYSNACIIHKNASG